MNKVKQIYAKLSDFSYYDIPEKDDYICITQWANMEGWDIQVGNKFISLHDTELNAINHIVQLIDYDFKEE